MSQLRKLYADLYRHDQKRTSIVDQIETIERRKIRKKLKGHHEEQVVSFSHGGVDVLRIGRTSCLVNHHFAGEIVIDLLDIDVDRISPY